MRDSVSEECMETSTIKSTLVAYQVAGLTQLRDTANSALALNAIFRARARSGDDFEQCGLKLSGGA